MESENSFSVSFDLGGFARFNSPKAERIHFVHLSWGGTTTQPHSPPTVVTMASQSTSQSDLVHAIDHLLKTSFPDGIHGFHTAGSKQKKMRSCSECLWRVVNHFRLALEN
jgi:hypothetical protein